MEDPFPEDQGRRVLVLHYGQAQQCTNCLKVSQNCQAIGKGETIQRRDEYTKGKNVCLYEQSKDL